MCTRVCACVRAFVRVGGEGGQVSVGTDEIGVTMIRNVVSETRSRVPSVLHDCPHCRHSRAAFVSYLQVDDQNEDPLPRQDGGGADKRVPEHDTLRELHRPLHLCWLVFAYCCQPLFLLGAGRRSDAPHGSLAGQIDARDHPTLTKDPARDLWYSVARLTTRRTNEERVRKKCQHKWWK